MDPHAQEISYPIGLRVHFSDGSPENCSNVLGFVPDSIIPYDSSFYCYYYSFFYHLLYTATCANI